MIPKLRDFFAKFNLRQDLGSHAFWGMVIYWLGAWHSPEMGFVLALIAALGKDILVDLLGKSGQFDPADILMTVALPTMLMAQSKFIY